MIYSWLVALKFNVNKVESLVLNMIDVTFFYLTFLLSHFRVHFFCGSWWYYWSPDLLPDTNYHIFSHGEKNVEKVFLLTFDTVNDEHIEVEPADITLKFTSLKKKEW